MQPTKVFMTLAVGMALQVTAHPTASCDVSTHSFDVVSSSTVDFSNAKGAGIGLDNVVIADNSAGGVTGSYGRPWSIFNDTTIPAWSMNEQYLNGTFEVTPVAVAGTARIVAANGIFLVTYVQLTPDGDSDPDDDVTVFSKTVDTATFSSLGTETTVIVLSPDFDFLSAGSSGFFYSAVSGSDVSVMKTTTGSSWSALDASAITTATSNPIAATVDSSGNYLLVYHTSATDLACALSSQGKTALQVKGTPLATGLNLAVAAGPAGVFMVLASNAGDLHYSISQDVAVTWGASQLMVNTSMVYDNTTVGLIKTTSRWVAAVLAQSGKDITTFSTKVALPGPTDWANFTQIKSAGTLGYRAPFFQGTGGEGYMIATTDTLSNDVYVRPCYDAPVPTASPTSDSNANTHSVLVSATMVVSVALMLA